MASRYICLICRNPIPHAGAECPHCKARSTEVVGASSQTLLLVFALMVVLILVTRAYDRAFDEELTHRAEEHFALARTYADYGYYEEAVENYRDALLHSRENFEYRLGLALSLYYLGRYEEARNQLLELRTLNPVDATTNRLLARLAARLGNVEEAANFYRAAIYGRWPSSPEENRLETRFELIELLEAERRYQAVGELLSLLREEPDNPVLERRVAEHFLELGASAEAATLYRNLIDERGADLDLLVGLGQASMQMRDFTAAERYLTRALQYERNDEIRRMRDLARQVISIDPTVRGISQNERYRRSRRLLERTQDYVKFCANPFGEEFVGPPAPLPQPAEAALDLAEAALDVTRAPSEPNQATEANLLLAENLWTVRGQVCTNIWQEDEPLSLLLDKLTR